MRINDWFINSLVKIIQLSFMKAFENHQNSDSLSFRIPCKLYGFEFLRVSVLTTGNRLSELIKDEIESILSNCIYLCIYCITIELVFQRHSFLKFIPYDSDSLFPFFRQSKYPESAVRCWCAHTIFLENHVKRKFLFMPPHDDFINSGGGSFFSRFAEFFTLRFFAAAIPSACCWRIASEGCQQRCILNWGRSLATFGKWVHNMT